MIKVLLVDDEAIARMNLRCLIDWEKNGFTICGEADSGFEALKKVDELKPNIIITDMNMPGMSGSELVKKVKNILPETRIVAFSAFEDFEYVRQSLKEGALDYLIKHKVDGKMLISILNSIKENIDEEYVEKQRINKIMEMASSGKVLIQKNVLLNLLNGYIKENFNALMEKYDICLEEKNLVLAVARIDSYFQIKEKFAPQEFAVFWETIGNILSNVCMELEKTEYVFLDHGKIAFIMSFAHISSEAQITSKSMTNLCTIEGAVKKFLNISLSFGVSNLCSSFIKINDYYIEACTALEDGYYKGSSYIVQKSELKNINQVQKFDRLRTSDEKSIVSNIRELKKEVLGKNIEEIFLNIKENKVPFNSVKIICVELVSILERMLKEYDVTSSFIYKNNVNLYEEISRFRTINELKEWFIDLYSSLIDELKVSQIKSDYSQTVKKAIEYIRCNYYRDISLSDVSKYVDVSPQYLSKLFKDECGKGFVHFLSNVRIEKAKCLIKEGVKIKDLAEKTGFNNYTYFFTVFKEITGMTPQQYEKSLS